MAVETTLRQTLGAGAVDDVKAQAGLANQRFDTMSKHSLADFLSLQEHAAKALTKSCGSFEEAVRRMGAASVDTFLESIAGKTMALLAGKDPTRLLSAAPNGYGLLVSYGRRSWKQLSATSGVFTFEEEYLGAVHNYGTFESAIRVVNGIRPRFELDQKSLLNFSLKVSW